MKKSCREIKNTSFQWPFVLNYSHNASLSTTGLKLVSRLLNKILKELIFCRNTTLFLVFFLYNMLMTNFFPREFGWTLFFLKFACGRSLFRTLLSLVSYSVASPTAYGDRLRSGSNCLLLIDTWVQLSVGSWDSHDDEFTSSIALVKKRFLNRLGDRLSTITGWSRAGARI